MVEVKIGRRLQEQRKQKGYTQEVLAEKIGVSTNYLSAVERGINQLNYDKLVEAMNILGCSADDIFCDVVKNSSLGRMSRLSKRLDELSIAEQKKIMDVVEVMIGDNK